MSIYKKTVYQIVIFCLVLQSFPVNAINPLFDKTRLVSEESTSQEDQAIFWFRAAHELDELAIKTLAKNRFYNQARDTLIRAKAFYKFALSLDPNNLLIQAFCDAHDSAMGGTLIPGEPEAKLTLSFLYDRQADTNDEHDASLNDSHLSTFWLASKADPEQALYAMAPKNIKPQDNSHKKIQLGAVAAASFFAGGITYGVTRYLTEDVFIQYGSAGGAAVLVIFTYLIGYLIASCCENRYGKTHALKKYQDIVKIIGKAIPGGPKEVEVTIHTDTTERSARRRQDIDVEVQLPSDVLDLLPRHAQIAYFNDLAENGPQGRIVQTILQANRTLRTERRPSAVRHRNVLAAIVEQGDEDESGEGDGEGSSTTTSKAKGKKKRLKRSDGGTDFHYTELADDDEDDE